MADKFRDRKFLFMLYPDNEEHAKAVEKIKKSYDYAGILHDRDYFTEEDEKKNPEHVAGTLKKPHWHIIIRVTGKNPIWSSALCKELGVDERFCEKPKSFENALMYLIHYNDIDKAQYDPTEVFGSIKNKLMECLNNVSKSEGEKVSELIEYIESQNEIITIKNFARYCAQNGYWAEFRRSASIFIKIIDEHNGKS